jgi:sodium pump decarboxylase gamma subunit
MTILDFLGQFGISTLPSTGIVILLLIILMLIISRVDKFITSRYPPKPEETTAGLVHAPVYAAGDGGAITAAITAAVTEYRKSR